MAAFLGISLRQWTGILIVVLTGGFAQTMMKMGTDRVGKFGETPPLEYLFQLLTSPFILLAITAYGFGVILYMFMLSRMDLSFLYPVSVAMGLVLATLVGSSIFREPISFLRLGGIAVVIVGVFLVGRS